MKAENNKFPWWSVIPATDHTDVDTPPSGVEALFMVLDPADDQLAYLQRKRDNGNVYELNRAPQRLGPFLVQWDDSGIGAGGKELFTPQLNDHIVDAFIEVVTTFTGSGGFGLAFPIIQTDTDVLFDTSDNSIGVNAAGVGTDIYRAAALGTLDGMSLASFATLLQYKAVVQGLPTRVRNAAPVKLDLIPDAGALTAGLLSITFWVARRTIVSD